ncbi:hypothetical protein KJ785_01810 [Patescibacteria group bacterium]|nr:hypothetical protein [Patescibacteria group bacterium]
MTEKIKQRIAELEKELGSLKKKLRLASVKVWVGVCWTSSGNREVHPAPEEWEEDDLFCCVKGQVLALSHVDFSNWALGKCTTIWEISKKRPTLIKWLEEPRDRGWAKAFASKKEAREWVELFTAPE